MSCSDVCGTSSSISDRYTDTPQLLDHVQIYDEHEKQTEIVNVYASMEDHIIQSEEELVAVASTSNQSDKVFKLLCEQTTLREDH